MALICNHNERCQIKFREYTAQAGFFDSLRPQKNQTQLTQNSNH